jgi:hypothetical protein
MFQLERARKVASLTTFILASAPKRAFLATTFFAAMLGCVGAVETGDATEVDVATSAVNGTYHIDASCTALEASQARSALDAFRAMLLDGRLLNCLKDGVLGGYHDPNPLWDFPRVPLYPEAIVRVLLTDSTSVYCGGEVDGNTGSGWIMPEGVTVDRDWFAQNPADFTLDKKGALAGIMAHELSHSHFYSDGPVSGLNPENKIIAPEQIARCVHSIVDPAQIDRPNGAIRLEMALWSNEAVLAPVGQAYGGAPTPQMQCSLPDFAIGFDGRAGASIDALGLACSQVAFGPKGGPGGTPFSLRCLSEEVMVGIHGRAGGVLESIGPICAARNTVLAGGSARTLRASVGGGPAENAFQRVCPLENAVKAIRLRVGGLVDRIEVVCQRVGDPRAIYLDQLPKLGGTGGELTRLETCPSRSAMHKLVTSYSPNWDAGVGRLSGACKIVRNTAQDQPVSSPPANTDAERCEQAAPAACTRQFVAGVGTMGQGPGFVFDQDTCGDDGLLIGIEATTQTWIRNIRGVCLPTATDIAAWTGAPNIPFIRKTLTPARGRFDPSDPAPIRRECPKGEFMVGFQATSGAYLDSVEIVCRRF